MNIRKITKELLIVCFFAFLSNALSPLFGIITFFLLLFFSIINDSKDNLLILFFLLPNIRILDVVGQTFLINIILLLISLKYFLKNNKNSQDNIPRIRAKYYMCFVLVFILEIIHIVTTQIPILNEAINAVNLAYDYMLCIFIFNSNLNKKDYYYLSSALVLGAICSSIIFIMANPIVVQMIFNSKYRLSAYGNDSNYLSIYVILGLSGIFLKMYDSKIELKDIIIVIISLGICFFAASKACIICIVLLFLYFIFSLIINGKLKKIIGIFLKFSPVVIATFLVFNNQINYLLSKIIERFGTTGNITIAELTTGRSIIASQYLEIMSNNLISLFFGRGAGYLNFYQDYGMTFVAHNTYLDFLLSWGIVGTLLFILNLLYNIVLHLKKYEYKEKSINFMPLFFLLIMVFSLSCMSADMFWYILAFSLIPLKLNYSRKKEYKNEIKD